ncbi:MAG: hypothetical protein R3C26_08575 [Calditrichia bacterium]|nr:hypothetical protein [Calditrichota bacterium]
MMAKKWLIALFCSAFLMNATAHAGLFDDRFPSPKLNAMGGAGVAINSGIWAGYYNPAALSQVSRIGVGSSYQRIFNTPFLNNFFGAAAYPISPKYGTIGVNIEYFGVDYEGENLTGEYALRLSHGFDLLRDINSSLSFGYSLKFQYLTYGESVGGQELGNANVIGLDVGFQASVYSRTFVGVYFLNLNAPQVGSESPRDLPQRIVAGIAYQPYDGVTTTLDINRSLDANQNEVWGGAEFRVFDMLDLRFGGTTNPNRFTAGLGINFKQFSIDYALKTHSELGETHVFGILYGL